MVQILILEDDDSLRQALIAILEDQGYAVEGASSGEQAVGMAQQRTYDLIVSDVRMPGMDGLDALARLRETSPGLRSVVVTGYSTEADSIRAIRLGVGEYLKKPFPMEVFLNAVARQIDELVRERQLALREEALARAALWTLETVARSQDLQAVVDLGGMAVRAGALLGLAARTDLQMAVLLGALERRAPGEIPDFLRPGLSPLGLSLLLYATAPKPESALGMEFELARGLLQLDEHGLEGLPEGPASEVLLDVWTGQDSAPAEPLPTSHKGLVWLGRTLEDGGDLVSAERAYRDVLEHSKVGPEAAEAYLGLARLAGLRGQPVAELAEEAVTAARRLGPVAAAWTSVEAASLMLKDQRVLPWVEQAGRLFVQLGVAAGEARARLLWMVIKGEVDVAGLEQALQVLQAPAHSPELAASVRWLIPWLRERQSVQPQPFLERALRRLATQFPKEMGSVNAPEALPALRVHSFGGFEVYRGEEPVTRWRSQKGRLLLAYMAAHAPRLVTEDVIIDLFWPDDAVKGKGNLSATLHHLRKDLRPTGWEGEVNYFVRSPGGVRMNPDTPLWHDLTELERSHAQARQAANPVAHLRQVARLGRGAYLEGCYTDWALAIRTRVEGQLAEALLALAQAGLEGGRPEEAREYAQQLLEQDPCHQEAAQHLMQALVSLGRSQEAVRLYEGFKKTLARELKMEPSIALMRCHQQALLNL